MGFKGAFALDFGTVMQMGQAMDVDLAFLADLLPQAEALIVGGLRDADEPEE